MLQPYMSLVDLVDNTRTDKNTAHSYLDLYQELLVDKKDTATNVLEIGIGDGHQGISDGGSIRLWHDFFTKATVYALDIKHIDGVWDGVKNNNRIRLYTSHDAYDEALFQRNFGSIKFDLVLDDGPHTLDSILQCVRLYTQVLADDGILIIEDVQHWEHIELLRNEVPAELRQYVHVYDLRHIKGRYDDIVFTVNKSKK